MPVIVWLAVDKLEPLRLEYARPARRSYSYSALSFRCLIAAAAAALAGIVSLRLQNSAWSEPFVAVVAAVLGLSMFTAALCGALFANRALRFRSGSLIVAALLLAINLLLASVVPMCLLIRLGTHVKE
jgi:hypothetical protein